jgi:hypothetical protein
MAKQKRKLLRPHGDLIYHLVRVILRIEKQELAEALDVNVRTVDSILSPTPKYSMSNGVYDELYRTLNAHLKKGGRAEIRQEELLADFAGAYTSGLQLEKFANRRLPILESRAAPSDRDQTAEDSEIRGALPVQSWYFPDYESAYSDFRRRVETSFKAAEEVRVQWIGLTMEHGSVNLPILFANPSVRVRLDIRMLHPEWQGLNCLDQAWKHRTHAGYQSLFHFFERHHRAESLVTGELFGYSEQPHIHGFSINERYYYVSWANWDQDIFYIVGRQGYDFFEAGKGDLRAEKRIALFCSWFAHFRQHQLFPDPKAGEAHARRRIK